MDAILDDPVRGPMITAADILGWTYRADGRLFATRGGINRAPREQRPDIATPEELEALKKKLGVDATDQRDFLNGPEFQRLFDTLWASSKPMRYRAWREYRDARPDLVLLWNDDEYPELTAAVERADPGGGPRRDTASRSRALEPGHGLVHGAPGETYLVYTMAGQRRAARPVDGRRVVLGHVDRRVRRPDTDIPPDRFWRSNRDARATRRVGRQAVGRVAVADGSMNGVQDMRRLVIVSVVGLAGALLARARIADGATGRRLAGAGRRAPWIPGA